MSTLPTDKDARKATPIATGVLDYFPLAIAEIARVSKAGNDQHNPGSWEAVVKLRAKGYDIAFVSSCHTPEHAEVKFSWLVRNGFLPKTGQADFLSLKDKSRAPVDVLVDDSYENVRTFKGQYACLVTAPYNRLNPWLGMRCKSLQEFEMRTPALRLPNAVSTDTATTYTVCEA